MQHQGCNIPVISVFLLEILLETTWQITAIKIINFKCTCNSIFTFKFQYNKQTR